MRQLTRRSILAAPAMLPLLRAPSAKAATPTRIRFTLDWKYQGAQSWFFLARDKGYFRDENLDVTIDQGEGSAAVISRIMTGSYDAGFGDLTALVVEAADRPGLNPIMVYEIYNRCPSCLIVRADGPIRTLKDVEGRTLGAPAGSATARLFPLLARRNGVEMSRVSILNVSPSLEYQMVARGQIDGLLAFDLTSYSNFLQMKLDPEKEFRWFMYADYGLDLYSDGVMVSQALAREKPEAVRGLVRAINRGLKHAVANLDEAADTIVAVEPLLNRAIERRRIDYTLRHDMITPLTEAQGFGSMDAAKLAGSIKTVVEGYGLARTPSASELYDPSFLPPAADRQIALPT